MGLRGADDLALVSGPCCFRFPDILPPVITGELAAGSTCAGLAFDDYFHF